MRAVAIEKYDTGKFGVDPKYWFKTITEKIEIYGAKKCSKCGVEFPNIKEYFYQTTGTKDGLRNDCKRCQDTQKLRREISHLKELDTVSIGEAKEAEIKELKRIIDTGNTEKENLAKMKYRNPIN